MLAAMHNQPQYRPPAEAESLILQVDVGCPHNRCAFCGMYKGLRYERRSLADVRKLIVREAAHDRGARRVFLADGDVMRRPYEELLAILTDLAAAFPDLARVNLYATGSAIASKSDAQLRQLREHRLHTLYLGLESGDEEILRRMQKGETAATMVEATVRAQAAGLRVSVMILLGLGGREQSASHAAATAAALNRMQPCLLSALRVVPVPGTELGAAVHDGSFTPVSEEGAIRELRDLVAGLELTHTVFRANHTSNVVPLEARLPRDKARLLAELDAVLATGALDREGPGRVPWML